MEVTEDLMWDAVITNNPEYDGKFFYGVKTTGIVCKPSCKSKNPRRKNVRYFSVVSLALDEGFRPCKRCRPDLLHPSNDLAAIYKAKEVIEKEYTNDLPLKDLAKRVGMSMYHFQRTFKKELGYSPSDYISHLRLKRSIQLLEETNLTITQIAQELGYGHAAYFSVSFRNYMSCTPTKYRKRKME